MLQKNPFRQFHPLSGCRDSGVGCGVLGAGCRVWGVDSRVSGIDCLVSGVECRVLGVGDTERQSHKQLWYVVFGVWPVGHASAI